MIYSPVEETPSDGDEVTDEKTPPIESTSGSVLDRLIFGFLFYALIAINVYLFVAYIISVKSKTKVKVMH